MTDIYFRTDGNSEIATGHLMRCLAIARACARMGAAVAFIVSDEESLSLLRERFAVPQEFQVCSLHTDFKTRSRRFLRCCPVRFSAEQTTLWARRKTCFAVTLSMQTRLLFLMFFTSGRGFSSTPIMPPRIFSGAAQLFPRGISG